MQRGAPPSAGLAQMAGGGQSAVRVQEPPAGTHSFTPSPQRSAQMKPLAQSAALAHGPKGPHIPSTCSGLTPQTSPGAEQSPFERQPRPFP